MRISIYFFFLFPLFCLSQQNPVFKNEVTDITKKYDSIWDSTQETIVFTGSSSVRLWKNLEYIFPHFQVLNTGFGGSEISDLLGYSKELILNYNPKKVFIYEGDNDLWAKKKSKEILSSFSTLIKEIKEKDISTKIVIISPKPSIARWNLRSKYKQLNRKLKRICKKDANLEFANVWDIMLNRKKLKTELFINDGLHMNNEGYDLWYSVIKKYIE